MLLKRQAGRSEKEISRLSQKRSKNLSSTITIINISTMKKNILIVDDDVETSSKI